MSAQAFAIDPAVDSQLHRLPLVTLYLTERCNSRCVTCDYWRHGRADMNLAAVKRLYLLGKNDRPTGTFTFAELLAHELSVERTSRLGGS